MQSRPAGAPVMAVVSLSRQRVTVYDADGWIMRAPVSSGQTGYETPAGVYSILQRKAEHFSNLYDDAAMPFMQRLTWSGIALHAGALPGYPASHGCVRMPHGFAERLFDVTRLGMRVVVMRDDIGPADISHPVLFKPASGEPRCRSVGPSVVALGAEPRCSRRSEPARDRGSKGGRSGGRIEAAGAGASGRGGEVQGSGTREQDAAHGSGLEDQGRGAPEGGRTAPRARPRSRLRWRRLEDLKAKALAKLSETQAAA